MLTLWSFLAPSELATPAPPHQLYTSLSEMDKRFDELVASRAVAASSG